LVVSGIASLSRIYGEQGFAVVGMVSDTVSGGGLEYSRVDFGVVEASVRLPSGIARVPLQRGMVTRASTALLRYSILPGHQLRWHL